MRPRRTGALLVGLATAVLCLPAGADFYAGLLAYDRGDYAAARAAWLPLAEAGDASAQANLAVLYLRGQGVDEDPAAAARWFRLAAVQGNPIAQDNLGQLYYQGRGVEQDFEEAARWIKAAAYQGDPSAQLRLGTLFAEGIGVPQDGERARSWWKKSAAQGNPLAKARLEDESAAGPIADAAPEPTAPVVPEADPIASAPSEPAPSVVPESQGRSGVLVQIASVFAEEDVEPEWKRLQRRNRDLLGDLDLDVQRVELESRVVYRLRAGPLPDRAQAEELCERLAERRLGCLLRTAP